MTSVVDSNPALEDTPPPDWGSELAIALAAIEGDLPSFMRAIPADKIPQPQRDLLNHTRDMTGMLTAHFGQPMKIRVLAKTSIDHQGARVLQRLVTLNGVTDGSVSEIGAIRIQLDALDEATRTMVESCEHPLGGILRDRSIPCSTSTKDFLAIDPDPLILAALACEHETPPPILYGRRAQVFINKSTPVATVLEILPPLNQTCSNGQAGTM